MISRERTPGFLHTILPLGPSALVISGSTPWRQCRLTDQHLRSGLGVLLFFSHQSYDASLLRSFQPQIQRARSPKRPVSFPLNMESFETLVLGIPDRSTQTKSWVRLWSSSLSVESCDVVTSAMPRSVCRSLTRKTPPNPNFKQLDFYGDATETFLRDKQKRSQIKQNRVQTNLTLPVTVICSVQAG